MKRYVAISLICLLLLPGCINCRECPEVTKEISHIPEFYFYEPSLNVTMPSVNVTVEPIVPTEVYVCLDEVPSAYLGKEHLLIDSFGRYFYDTDKRNWTINEKTLTYTGGLVWEMKVEFANGSVETYSFNEGFGWH